jgi:hypothetical protein
MRTRTIKTLKWAEKEGIYILKNGNYISITIKCWDRLFNSGKLSKFGYNRWEYELRIN